MPFSPFITYILIIANVLVSYRGFRSNAFFERYYFKVDYVLVEKRYITLISSAFLHINWMHLILNMISLYIFGEVLEMILGSLQYAIVYFAGALGGILFTLFIHRRHGDYSCAGASGAISGLMFATIALIPGIIVRPLGIPIPGWLYGLAYVLYSIYGVRSKKDNIGHEAHLGGALVGMLTAIAFHPGSLIQNYGAVAVILFPAVVFIFIIVTRPYVLFIDNLFYKEHMANATIDDRYNLAKSMEQREIDAILEKIHRKGINSLSKTEKEKLDRYSSS